MLSSERIFKRVGVESIKRHLKFAKENPFTDFPQIVGSFPWVEIDLWNAKVFIDSMCCQIWFNIDNHDDSMHLAYSDLERMVIKRFVEEVDKGNYFKKVKR